MRGTTFAAAVAAAAVALGAAAPAMAQDEPSDLWQAYTEVLSKSRYIDLTHTLTPFQPVWKGFGASSFSPTLNPLTGQPYTFAADGFEATAYQLVDRPVRHAAGPARALGARVPGDRRAAGHLRRPPARGHLDRQAAQDEGRLPPAGRRHHQAWEKQHGRIPEGSVVMVRSDWSKKWTTDPVKAKALAAETVFPGVVAQGHPVPAPEAPHPVPRPRAAGHRHHAHARG